MLLKPSTRKGKWEPGSCLWMQPFLPSSPGMAKGPGAGVGACQGPGCAPATGLAWLGRPTRWSCCSPQPCWSHAWSVVSRSGLLSTRETGSSQGRYSRGAQVWLRDRSISLTGECLRELAPSALRRNGWEGNSSVSEGRVPRRWIQALLGGAEQRQWIESDAQEEDEEELS